MQDDERCMCRVHLDFLLNGQGRSPYDVAVACCLYENASIQHCFSQVFSGGRLFYRNGLFVHLCVASLFFNLVVQGMMPQLFHSSAAGGAGDRDVFLLNQIEGRIRWLQQDVTSHTGQLGTGMGPPSFLMQINTSGQSLIATRSDERLGCGCSATQDRSGLDKQQIDAALLAAFVFVLGPRRQVLPSDSSAISSSSSSSISSSSSSIKWSSLAAEFSSTNSMELQ
jgi:hypothetical protein